MSEQDRIEAAKWAAIWALCKLAGGAGEGKCEPFKNCVCGNEGKVAARAALAAADRVAGEGWNEAIEAAAKCAEQEVDTYYEGMSAIDVRLSNRRGLKWHDGRSIAQAIRALSRLPARAEGKSWRTMEWQDVADMSCIEERAYYLVQTNAGEWRDFDLGVLPGFLVIAHLKPDYVRGRPLRVVKITTPPSPSATAEDSCD